MAVVWGVRPSQYSSTGRGARTWTAVRMNARCMGSAASNTSGVGKRLGGDLRSSGSSRGAQSSSCGRCISPPSPSLPRPPEGAA